MQAEAIAKVIRDGHGEFVAKNDITQLRNELKSDINQLRNELKSDINELKNEIELSENRLKNDIDQLKSDVSWLKWIAGIQIAVVISAATIIVALLK